MHVRDVADAFVALLASLVEGPVNIASGRSVQLADVARSIAGCLGAEYLLKLGALSAAPDDPPVLTASVERLNREVNWTPAIPLDQGLAETIAWWRGHRL